MIGGMLVGAWLLIHHHCCGLGEEEMRVRSPALVDSLMRRSPLEKHFMRFGRSSTTFLPQSGAYTHEKQDNDKRKHVADVSFIRYGRNPNMIRFGRGNNYMRFGRSQKPEEIQRVGRSKSTGFMRFGRSNQNFEKLSQLQRMNRAQGFIRFGRSPTDGYIRFGRSSLSPINTGFMTQPITSLPLSTFAGFTKNDYPAESHLGK